jgi:hypothetical protein
VSELVTILQWYGAAVVVFFFGEMLNADHGLLPTLAFALAAPAAIPLLMVAALCELLWSGVRWLCGAEVPR